MVIPISDITKKFFLYLILDSNHPENSYPIPDLNPAVAEPGAIELFYFFTNCPIVGPHGKMETGGAISYPNS
jgi:hypothetical protein